ncbi:MAG: GAK system CofD-like protein [Planctomycetota bacterium]
MEGSDPRVERYWRTPSHGPRILFFSGGTALRGIVRVLKNSTWNSVHIVTPFDSGGSSAAIREAFHMLSVGDLRNRMLALADEGPEGDPALFQLFAFRLPEDADPAELRHRMHRMVDGRDELIEPIADPVRAVVRELLGSVAEAMPPDFDLRGASIGNLVLAGGYLREGRDMAAVLKELSDFVRVRGVVRPVTEQDLQLGATLEDGSRVIGQHRLTGKEQAPPDSPIREIFLAKDGVPTEASATVEVLDLIANAEMIVYPVGSFYSSVLCNLLPAGVGRAIVECDAPKIYLPNTGTDPEQKSLPIEEALERIIAAVRADAGEEVAIPRIVSTLLYDRRDDLYDSVPNVFRLALEGLEVIRMRLSDEGEARYDPQKVVHALLSLA